MTSPLATLEACRYAKAFAEAADLNTDDPETLGRILRSTGYWHFRLEERGSPEAAEIHQKLTTAKLFQRDIEHAHGLENLHLDDLCRIAELLEFHSRHRGELGTEAEIMADWRRNWLELISRPRVAAILADQKKAEAQR